MNSAVYEHPPDRCVSDMVCVCFVLFSLEEFREEEEEFSLLGTEVSALEYYISELWFGSSRDFHVLHSKGDTEQLPKMEPLEGHNAVE